MKKIITTILTGCLFFSILVTPAFAAGFDASAHDYFMRWFDWFYQTQEPESVPEEPIVEEPEPVVEPTLATPSITKASYTHKAKYGVGSNSLQVSWDEVEGAESYEAEIVKADGTSHVYTTTIPMLWIHAGDDDFITGCTHIYNADTHTWEAATVRVRAIAGEAFSEWSNEKRIPCNAFHISNAEAH